MSRPPDEMIERTFRVLRRTMHGHTVWDAFSIRGLGGRLDPRASHIVGDFTTREKHYAKAKATAIRCAKRWLAEHPR
ncbi:MAG: hypothetical protein KC591_05095 [Gemmatimonadetes bacterium]|nr:hypothetical protein [Gemmatimonadota bacterium]